MVATGWSGITPAIVIDGGAAGLDGWFVYGFVVFCFVIVGFGLIGCEVGNGF
jgi:hypothetical protein